MNPTAQFRRLALAASLILAPALSVLWVVLQPPAPTSTAEGLGNLSANLANSTLAAFAFTLSQLPFILAALGVSHVISRRAPVLAALGAGFAVLGGFGHAVLGGAQLVQLGMAADTSHRAVYVGLLDGGMPWPLNALMLGGTLGTVLGIILMAAGSCVRRLGRDGCPTHCGLSFWLNSQVATSPLGRALHQGCCTSPRSSPWQPWFGALQQVCGPASRV